MIHIFEALIAILLCVLLMLLLWELKRRLMLPVKESRDIELSIVLRAKGSAPSSSCT